MKLEEVPLKYCMENPYTKKNVVYLKLRFNWVLFLFVKSGNPSPKAAIVCNKWTTTRMVLVMWELQT